MSRCAHRQYHHLVKLPRCTKCKSQLTKVLSKYENGLEQWEWECTKCSKVFPITSFAIEDDDFGDFLHGKFNKEKENNTFLLTSKSQQRRRKNGRKRRR